MKSSVESDAHRVRVNADGVGPDISDVGALVAEADVLLAHLESRSVDLGYGAALPFLGLARFELAATDPPRADSREAIPPTYEDCAERVVQLMGQALSLCPSLEDCLHILRAQGLLREHDKWARRTPDVGATSRHGLRDADWGQP